MQQARLDSARNFHHQAGLPAIRTNDLIVLTFYTIENGVSKHTSGGKSGIEGSVVELCFSSVLP